MTWRFRLDDASPSQNVLDRMHWAVRREVKKEWAWRIRTNKDARKVPKADGPRSLDIERHGRGTLDTANLIGGLKGIIDELVLFGLFVDDRPEDLVLNLPTQHKLTKGQHPHTIFTISDLCNT